MSKKEQMFALVEQWRVSGLTRSVFSKQHGIGSQSFDYWCKKQHNEVVKPQLPVRSSTPKLPAKPPGFVELTCGDDFSPKSQPLRMELELAGGIRIKIY